MIEKPVAWINKDNTYVELSTKSTVYGSHTIPLFTESQLKAERESAIEMQLKINKELAETVTRLELEIARLISA
jgi:hypothetical protein